MIKQFPPDPIGLKKYSETENFKEVCSDASKYVEAKRNIPREILAVLIKHAILREIHYDYYKEIEELRQEQMKEQQFKKLMVEPEPVAGEQVAGDGKKKGGKPAAAVR